jgi:NTP pyrophosphatase (non-canonical NTP hydrolase)
MKLNEYQEKAAEYSDFGPETHQKQPESVSHLAMVGLGITGEAGEVSDYIKKVLFHGHPMDKTKLRKELGDALWYVQEGARAGGMTLEEIARENLDKLAARYPNGRFDPSHSQNRKPEDK